MQMHSSACCCQKCKADKQCEDRFVQSGSMHGMSLQLSQQIAIVCTLLAAAGSEGALFHRQSASHYQLNMRHELSAHAPCQPPLQVMMCANRWDDIKYDRVASVCMKRNKEHFERRDKARLDQYLLNVASGKKKIASGALKPHELVREAFAAAR